MIKNKSGISGICVAETMRFNGNGNWYAGNNSCDSGSSPSYNALTLSSGAEIGLWMWRQYLMDQDKALLTTNLPFMLEAARFLQSYAGAAGTDGKIHLSPSNAHAAGNSEVNPLTNGVRVEYCSLMRTRNPFEAPDVTSRRGGPAKQPLSRDAIVRVALQLLTNEGLEGMSLRKVAAALETGPASLYAYVEDLRELQTLVLDRALADVTIPAKSKRDWQVRLVSTLKSYVDVLSRSPGLAQLAMNTIAAGPNALKIIESLLGLLDEAGVDQPTAAWAVDLLTLYATAIAAEHGHWNQHGDPLGSVVRMLGSVSQVDFPRIHGAREFLVGGEGSERFSWAIDVLLAGIIQTPRSSVGSAKTSRTNLRKRTQRD